MTFQLDTTGAVQSRLSPTILLTWSDLSPFTQVYIEALFAGLGAAFRDGGIHAFSDLAPATLARIIADCEAMLSVHRALRFDDCDDSGAGRDFWENRQGGFLVDFPPLTVQIGDDSKVRFGA